MYLKPRKTPKHLKLKIQHNMDLLDSFRLLSAAKNYTPRRYSQDEEKLLFFRHFSRKPFPTEIAANANLVSASNDRGFSFKMSPANQLPGSRDDQGANGNQAKQLAIPKALRDDQPKQ